MANPESTVFRDGAKPYLTEIVMQHAEEAAHLHVVRAALLRAPHIRLSDLQRRFDDRLAAHLDGLSIAGADSWRLCEAALAIPSAGAVFTAAVRAIEDKREDRVDKLLALCEAIPDTRSGLLSAFGWLAQEQLQGIVVKQLGSSEPFRRMIGIAACAMHGLDPGFVSSQRILDPSRLVRARAVRMAGEVGCEAAIPSCVAAIRDEDPDVQFWAAWSSVLFGNRGAALDALSRAGQVDGLRQPRAFRLSLQAMGLSQTHELLSVLAQDPARQRWLIQGSGIAGDPVYVPWLIKRMADDKTARLAGEAFSTMTGADLEKLRLDRSRPENFESGPNDDPADPNVDMDEDDGLPWPDPGRIENWWAANQSRFQKGTRYFIGAPVTRGHCLEVLKDGYQRQRILAAHFLCLLEPGTPLFNTSAPAWRQQRLLAKMT